MPEKSSRRLKLEQSLAENPDDAFLRYGLAMQCLREGDIEEGRRGLRSLIEDDPDRQVAAYQQLGQSYVDTGEFGAAATILRTGLTKALAAGDRHAAAEMEQLIETVGS
jgi:thioredoxin-like negative regulator of GroEL